MSGGAEDSRSPWLRVSEALRASAWLPPGLALTWLAILATLVRSVSIMIADWAATVGLVVLLVLLIRRRTVPLDDIAQSADGDEPDTPSEPAPAAESVAGVQGAPASAGANVTVLELPPTTTADLAVLDMRVLTAEEVALLLRVKLDEIIASITKGELPGNRIGTEWRVEQQALTRWLQGPYGESR